jgi:hypothetical protein
MSFDGSSKQDELSLSTTGLPLPCDYHVTVLITSGDQVLSFVSRGERRWREWLGMIATATRAYEQTITLVHDGNVCSLVELDESIDVTCKWYNWCDVEIQLVVGITDLKLWYNKLLLEAFFDAWSNLNPWEELS